MNKTWITLAFGVLSIASSNAASVAFNANGTVDGVGYTLSSTAFADGNGASLNVNDSVTVIFLGPVNLILRANSGTSVQNSGTGMPGDEAFTAALTGGTWDTHTDTENEVNNVTGLTTASVTFDFRYAASGSPGSNLGDSGPNGNDYISQNQDWSFVSIGNVTQVTISKNNAGNLSSFELDATNAIPEPSSVGLASLGVLALVARRRRQG